MQNSPEKKGGSIVLALWFCPPGEPAINTPGSLALQTLPFGCLDKDCTGFIADRAPESLTVRTQRRFIAFFFVTHTITLKKYMLFPLKILYQMSFLSILFHRHSATECTANSKRNHRQNS